ncbi:MAG: hypothetical protein ACFFCP_11010 [Promethearchaeota archaeon]
MQNLSDTGYIVLFAVAIFVIGTWMIGRYKTSQLRNRIAQVVANLFTSTTSKVSVRLLGNTGAKFSFHQKSDGPLPKLEGTILLLDRSNIFHFAYCKIKHRTDQFQIRANIRGTASFNLELATRLEQKNLEASLRADSGKIHELAIESITEQFYVVTSNQEAGEHLFGNTHFRDDFESVAPYLTRLSIAQKDPNLFVSVILVPEAMEPVEKFVISLAKSLRRRKKKN